MTVKTARTPQSRAATHPRIALVNPRPVDLGARLRDLRKARHWTLAEAANRTDLARSTLSKIENRQMSPTFDVLQKIATGFGLDVATLLASPGPSPPLARRSITRQGQGTPYVMPNYDHEFLCTELAHRKFTPIRTRVRARSFTDFSGWIRHPGEDYVLVLEGAVEFYSEFYEPVRLAAGDCVHYDSAMGHAFISVSQKDALLLWVSAA